MAFDNSSWGTPAQVHEKTYAKAANAETCAEYFTDGGWNIGGWSTYPSAEARAAGGGTARPKGPREPRT